MRILFLGVPLHGHLRPTRDFLTELVRRGHVVRVVAGGQATSVLARSGVETAPYRTPAVQQVIYSLDTIPRLPLTVMEVTEAVLRDDLAAFRTWSPDVVIADVLAPWGYWVAELLDVPVVSSVPTLAMSPRVVIAALLQGLPTRRPGATWKKLKALRMAGRLVRTLRQAHGVRGVGPSVTAFPAARLNIAYTTRAFQPQGGHFDPARWYFAGPPMDHGRPVADRSRTRVFVSMGTLFQGDGTLRLCAEALGDDSRDVVISTGGAPLPTGMEGTPRVQWRSFVEQDEELARSAVFVTHAGLGSVQEALLAGVPMVLLPRTAEQEFVAARVAQLGAGVMLRRTQVTSTAIREALTRVDQTPSFGEAAARLGSDFRLDSSVRPACDAVESCVATNGE